MVPGAGLDELVAEYDLVVDLEEGVLRSRHAAAPVVVTDFMARLIARLAEAATPVSPKRLFEDVWNGPEYHPLRHRNSLYVAVARARRILGVALGKGDVISSRAGGWIFSSALAVGVLRPSTRSPARLLQAVELAPDRSDQTK
jgi:hypothetical protein